MIRRLFRFALKLGLTAAVGAAVSKVLAGRRSQAFPPPSSAPWPPIETPATPATPEPVDTKAPDAVTGADRTDEAVADEVVADEAVADEVVADEVVADEVVADEVVADEAVSWVEPDDEGECPPSHPLKAKLSSGVFHLPGMANYERTKADRCYSDESTAEADDLRQAKR